MHDTSRSVAWITTASPVEQAPQPTFHSRRGNWRGMREKLFVFALLVFLAVHDARAQTTRKAKHPAAGATNNAAGAPVTTTAQQTQDQVQAVHLAQNQFIPADPWRTLDDSTNYAKGKEWFQFEGRVTKVSAGEVELHGRFGEPLFYLLPGNAASPEVTFTITNYPRAVFVGQLLSRNDRLVAHRKSGTGGGANGFEYGRVWVPKLTEEQKTRIAQAKSEGDEKILAFQKDLAEKGDAYGQYKMGLRYSTGDGVDKDLPKARELLTKASAQGSQDAADALAKLGPDN